MLARFALALSCVLMVSACFNTAKDPNKFGDGPNGKPAPAKSELTAHAWCVNGFGSSGAAIQQRYSFSTMMTFEYNELQMSGGGRTGGVNLTVRGTYTLLDDTLEMRGSGGEYVKYDVGYTQRDTKSGTEKLYAKDDSGAVIELFGCL